MRHRCAAALAVFAALVSARADEAPAFKRINLLVGFGAGESGDAANQSDSSDAPRLSGEPAYDQAARFYAAHLGAFLPGRPAIDVRLVPGGASLVAARRLIEAAPDGSTLALLGAHPVFAAITGEARGFDPRGLAWIGARQRDDDVCIARAGAPVASIGDAQQRQAFAAALTPGSKSYLYPRALNVLAGTQFRIVAGYASGFEIARALETGETDVWCGWSIAALRLRYPDLLRSGKARLLVQFSRDPEALRIPAASALPATPDARAAMDLLERQTRFQAFALAASAKTDPARLAALRAGFLAMLRDPVVVGDALRLGLEIDPVSGEELEREAAGVVGATPRARALLAEVLRAR